MGNEQVQQPIYQRPPPTAIQQHIAQLQQHTHNSNAHAPGTGGRESFERRKYMAQNRLRQNYYREYGSSVAAASVAANHQHSYQRKVHGSSIVTTSPRRSYNSYYPRRATPKNLNHSAKEDFDSPASSILAFATTNTHKGLINNQGQNNCFLNATIQALWHVGPFRVELQDFLVAHPHLITDGKTEPNHGQEPSTVQHHSTTDAQNPAPPALTHNEKMLRALGNIFYQIEYGTEPVVSPDELRRVISQHESGHFRVGEQSDANETLEAILESIHSEWSPACPSAIDGSKCIGHTVFGGLLMEQGICQECGSSSEPILRSDFVHYIYAAELIELAKEQQQQQHPLLHQPHPSRSIDRPRTPTGFGDSLLFTQTPPMPSIGGRPGSMQRSNHGLSRSNHGSVPGSTDHATNGVSPLPPPPTPPPPFNNTPGSMSNSMGGSTNANGSGSLFGQLLRKCLAVSPLSCPANEDTTNNTTQASTASTSATFLTAATTLASPIKTLATSTTIKPPPCPGKTLVSIHALEAPLALAISIGWTQANESTETLKTFLDLLTYRVQLADLFDIGNSVSGNNSPMGNLSPMAYDSPTVSSSARHFLMDPDSINNSRHGKNHHRPSSGKSTLSVTSNDGYEGTMGGSPSYVFRGFVGYYGLHYISVFQDRSGSSGDVEISGGGTGGAGGSGGAGGEGAKSSGAGGEGHFLLFDDMNVRSLGSWEDVKRQCVSAHLQPVLLLYELEQSLDQEVHTPRKQRSVKVQESGLGPHHGSGIGSESGGGSGGGAGSKEGSGMRSGRGPGGLVMDHSGGNNNHPCTTHNPLGHSDSHDSYDTPYVHSPNSPTRPHSSPVRLSRSEKGIDVLINSSSTEQKGRSGSSGQEENGLSTTVTVPATMTPPVQQRPVSMGGGLINSALSLLPWGRSRTKSGQQDDSQPLDKENQSQETGLDTAPGQGLGSADTSSKASSSDSYVLVEAPSMSPLATSAQGLWTPEPPVSPAATRLSEQQHQQPHPPPYDIPPATPPASSSSTGYGSGNNNSTSINHNTWRDMDSPPGWSQGSYEHKGQGPELVSTQEVTPGSGSESGQPGTIAIGTIALPSAAMNSEGLVTPMLSLSTSSKQPLVLHPSFVSSRPVSIASASTLEATLSTTTTPAAVVTSSMVPPSPPASPPAPASASMSNLQPLPPSSPHSSHSVNSPSSFSSTPSVSPPQPPPSTSGHSNHHPQPSSFIPNLRPQRLPRPSTDAGGGPVPGLAPLVPTPGLGLAPGSSVTDPLLRVSSSFIPPRMLIEKYSRVAKVIDVTIPYAYTQGRRLLGLEHGIDSNGHTVVVAFARGINDTLLPTEGSRKVMLMDRILAIEGIRIGEFEEGKRQVDSLFHHFGLETNRPNITLTLASSVLTELHVTCPYCETIHTLSELDEENLRQVAVGSREGGNYRCNVCNLASGTELLLTSNSLFL